MIRDYLRHRATDDPALPGALEDLRRLTTDRPELARAGATLAAAIRAAFGVVDRFTRVELPRQAVQAALSRGEPAIRAFNPVRDHTALVARAVAICEAIQARPLRRWVRRESSRYVACCEQALRLDSPLKRDANIPEPERFDAVVRLSLLPTLSAVARSLEPLLPEWNGPAGICPFCGERPLLAELRGLDQRRVMRCGRCAAAWPAIRLGCPSCGESDPHRLLAQSFEGQSARYRLLCCDACGSRLKLTATLAALSAPGLLVAELATIHLDAIPVNPA
jgi:FdhE protein